MGKFDGILLCTDLDATLLNDEHKVSEENIKAIDYFKSEGGMFTFVTGRVPNGARLMLEYVKPNAPVVTFNGAGIYDFEKEELKSYFPEFREYEGTCRFLGCNHVSEPGCMVKNALEEGKIHRTRYNDYLEMYCELEQKEKRRY